MKKVKSYCVGALLANILVLTIVSLANAQKAVLSGTVYDAQGAVIPGIDVKLKDKKGIEISTKTGDEGSYEIEVPAGFYTILFSARSGNFEQLKFKKYYLAP